MGEATWAVKANTSLTCEPCLGNLFIFSAAFPRAQPLSPGLTLGLSPWASGEQGKQTECEFFSNLMQQASWFQIPSKGPDTCRAFGFVPL